MFIQVIQGKVSDPSGLCQQLDRWTKEVQAGATGYLGSTFGVANNGEAIGIVRFDSAEAAARNSSRPEQGEWWAATEKMFDGPVTFHDSSDVDVFLLGGSDAAEFVQVMQGRIKDLARVRVLEAEALKTVSERRPDMIGSIRASYGDGEFTEFVYYTSEAAAREGEAKEQPESEAQIMADLHTVLAVERFHDLPEPWLFSG